MDLASLITPGPEPVLSKAKASNSPPASSSFKPSIEGSYFPTMPTSYSRSPQPPLSPPVDEQRKFSLPSISSLLEGADGAAMHAAKRQRLTPPARRESDARTQYDPISLHGLPANMPPTPPLRPDSGFHSNGYSPSASSTSAVKMESSYPQVPVTLPSPSERSSISSQGSIQNVSSGPYASPAPSVASYTSPVEPSTTAMYYQRPTSSTYQSAASPTAAPMPAAAAAHQPVISPVTPAWQHHHYFPPSNSTPYQQHHDRYICRTCHKAFSRPSSLRIHSHSHTGEKPFRCTHVGCGKAFSVRSNMKRHERGCHSGRPVAAAMV